MGSRGRHIGLLKWQQDCLLVLRSDTNSGVGDGKPQAKFRRHSPNLTNTNHDFACLRELDCVAEQIGNHLADPSSVTNQLRRNLTVDLAQDLQSFFTGFGGQNFRRTVNRFTNVKFIGRNLKVARLNDTNAQSTCAILQKCTEVDKRCCFDPARRRLSNQSRTRQIYSSMEINKRIFCGAAQHQRSGHQPTFQQSNTREQL